MNEFRRCEAPRYTHNHSLEGIKNMASISKDPAGNRTIQFIAADGKRRSIRLGKVNAKQAESLKLKIETLAASVASKLPLDSETSKWLGEIGAELAAKLAAVGLMPERSSRTLGEFLERYIVGRVGDSKPSTVVTIHQVAKDLKGFFGAGCALRSMTTEGAEDFKTPCRPGPVAAAFSEPPVLARNGSHAGTPDSRRRGLARKHAEGGAYALPSNSRPRFREGRSERCKFRCRRGAKCGADKSGPENLRNDKRDEKP